MKLATKIQLLVVGMAVAPIVISGIVLFAVRLFSAESEEVARHFEWRELIEEEIVGQLTEGQIPELEPLDHGFVVVTNNEPRVVASSIPNIAPVGAPPPQSESAERAAERYLEDSRVVVRLVEAPDGTQYRVVYSGPEVVDRPPPGVHGAAVIILVGLLLVGGGAGMWIMRDFSHRLRFLQAAIHRIAAGDLETPVNTKSQDEMASLATDLDSMRQAVRESREQRARLLMSLSHDLGTPLTTILGYIEALEDDVFQDQESRARSLHAVRNKAELLQDRINQLVEFVRLDSGIDSSEKERVSLSEYFREVARSMQRDAEVSNRNLEWHADLPEDATILVSRTLMERLFENLFQNALRYTREHDTIRLSARICPAGESAHGRSPSTSAHDELPEEQTRARGPEPDQFEIVFEDSGPGFGDMEPAESFELFRRGSHGRNEPGSGLGLSTVKSIAEMHGFSVHASTSTLGGAAFWLRGPLAPES
jgi:signal transduction histidine kinase